ncbi:MAG: winged helix-turn-helix transcriptional regulator [Chloroflexi bacterium]|nr:winged helix-turn-helix transcriptional regulator [Chloroflexota bacterium]
MTSGPVRSSRVEGTREDILALLRRHTSLTVEELAHELGLAGATVRRHLDVLLRDDLIAVAQVRGGPGRPRHTFSLTEAGAGALPHHYVRMTQRLLGEIVALQQDETSGRTGKEIAGVVFDRMASRIASEYAPRVTGATLEERARSVVALIATEGLDFEVFVEDDGIHLLGRGCLCSRADDPSAPVQPCEHDQAMLSALIGGVVRPLPLYRVPHEFHCGYLVTA